MLKDQESEEEYREVFCKAEITFQRYNQDKEDTRSQTDTEASVRGSSLLQGKYKRLTLPKINGDPRQCLNFYSKFKTIHEDNAISDDLKTQYLLECMEKPSEALVNAFPPSGDNYSLAFTHLKETFASDNVLSKFYCQDLLCLISNRLRNKDDKFPLVDFYFKLESYIRALDMLVLDTETFCTIWSSPLFQMNF